MFGLEYVLASQMMLAAATKTPTVTCQMKEAPKINVIAKGLDRGIDHSRTVHQLNAFKPSVGPSPYGEDAETYLQGVARGGVSVDGQYRYGGETYNKLGVSCLYVKQVDLVVTLDSTIFIAKDYPKGTCHYNAVLAHEKRHVAVDTQLVNKYSNIMVKAVNNTLKSIGYAQGPFPAARIPAVQAKIEAYLGEIVSQYAKNFTMERDMLQGQVDTLAEYDRVHALCKDWPEPVL
jgi:hypothetical protein